MRITSFFNQVCRQTKMKTILFLSELTSNDLCVLTFRGLSYVLVSHLKQSPMINHATAIALHFIFGSKISVLTDIFNSMKLNNNNKVLLGISAVVSN